MITAESENQRATQTNEVEFKPNEKGDHHETKL